MTNIPTSDTVLSSDEADALTQNAPPSTYLWADNEGRHEADIPYLVGEAIDLVVARGAPRVAFRVSLGTDRDEVTGILWAWLPEEEALLLARTPNEE